MTKTIENKTSIPLRWAHFRKEGMEEFYRDAYRLKNKLGRPLSDEEANKYFFKFAILISYHLFFHPTNLGKTNRQLKDNPELYFNQEI
jgi:hypothetical protein